MNKDTIVLGLGNPLMADEGIGTVLVEKLNARSGEFDNIEFIDAGTGGMQILHLISGKKKAVVIDCAFMGETPGTMVRFSYEDARTVKKLAHLSLHEVDIMKVIELSKQLGECPDEVVFFGIEPVMVEDGMELSESLQSKIECYIEEIANELK